MRSGGIRLLNLNCFTETYNKGKAGKFYIIIIIDRFYVVLFSAFKQKTAYEIASGLVGSEMCIRDRKSYSLM